jgi:hypothetical protein
MNSTQAASDEELVSTKFQPMAMKRRNMVKKTKSGREERAVRAATYGWSR